MTGVKRDKPLAWLHGEIKTPPFSREARIETGMLLRRLQRGEKLMRQAKRARLAAKGWRVASVAEFLDLTPEEAAFIETKLALSNYIRKRRTQQNLSQLNLAKRLKSSQSRVAKMEAGDATVSADLLLKALFALGAKPKDIGTAIQRQSGATV